MVPLLEVRGKNFETRTYYIYSCWHFIAKNAKQVRSIHEDKLSNNFALNWQSFVYTPSKHQISATRRSKILLFGTTNLVFSLMQNIKRTSSGIQEPWKNYEVSPKLAIIPKNNQVREEPTRCKDKRNKLGKSHLDFRWEACFRRRSHFFLVPCWNFHL